MEAQLLVNGKTLKYNLQYKKVKNINLRIKPDGTVNVSANRSVPREFIDRFVESKAEFILAAVEKYNNKPEKIQYFNETEIRKAIIDMCEKVYPYFEKRGVAYPEIKFRKMVSCWGNCRSAKGIITFNTNLMYAPPECVEYVVLHEFTHFLQQNHSKMFYLELEKTCPDWKKRRKRLRGINIR